MGRSNQIPKEYDFIVAGGGTAGLVVAGRLAENPNVTVLVIEAGEGNPKDIQDIQIPAQAFELRGGKHDWQYKCNMIDNPDYQRIEMKNTRGKVLGGSSSLNYYTWLPGSAGIYDEWVAFGGERWSYDNCKEYFKKSVAYHDDHKLLKPELAKEFGTKGPLDIAPSELAPELQTFRKALQDAWTSKGLPVTEDIYNGKVNGLAHTVVSIYNGVRTTSASFIEGKPNITLLSSTQTRKIIVEGNVATGILVNDEDDATVIYRARKEVILSQGVYETPKLLMISGIGPDEELIKHRIPCIVSSPHVGQNLMDHPIMPHVFKIKDGVGLDRFTRSGALHQEAVSTWERKKEGPMCSGLLEMVAFPRVDSRLEARPEWQAEKERTGLDVFGPGGRPHFEIDFVPMFASAFQWHYPVPPKGDYLTVIVDLLRPQSRGEIKLNSADPLDAPDINLGFYSNELDLVAMAEGVRFIDDVLMNGDGMKDLIIDDYPWPLPRDDDKLLRESILERSSTGFHPCGTTRMGKNIKEGVVDNQLRVFGVQGLRVIDASVIPVIPDCRIQSPVYMLAEKGSDMIKASHKDLDSDSFLSSMVDRTKDLV